MTTPSRSADAFRGVLPFVARIWRRRAGRVAAFTSAIAVSTLADVVLPVYGRPGATRDEIERAARLAVAPVVIAVLPRGNSTLVGERGVKLSGGGRQRVALARAFLADAPILVFDEATSSLDAESEAPMQEALERLMRGRTAMVIAHRLSTVRALDRILVFDRGRIVENGTHAALVRPSERQAALAESA